VSDQVSDKRVLLIVGGGVAAYKALELVRLLRKAGVGVRPILTRAGAEFVTALSLSALAEDKVYSELFSLTDEAEMGHIELSRSADLVVVAPATADLIAKAAHGLAGDLASTALLATDKPVLMAPAMNVRMWLHPATQRNIATLKADGVSFVGPDDGAMACGEFGPGRLAEPPVLFEAIMTALDGPAGPSFKNGPLAGKHALVTAGPTFEPIDPVRGITNLSSGKMGFAIARAAQEAGAQVTLVAGPVHLPTPRGVQRIDVRTAQQMHDAVLPAAKAHDVFVATAAVADWRPASLSEQKIKKNGSKIAPSFELTENPDILAAVARLPDRPYCVGFAAESHDLLKHAREKLERKNVPLVVGNLGPATFGRDDNALLLVDAQGQRELPQADKLTLARQLVGEIASRLSSASA